MRWPPQLPDEPRLVLRNVSVPACVVDVNAAFAATPDATPDASGLIRIDMLIDEGSIAAIGASDSSGSSGSSGSFASSYRNVPAIEFDGTQVWPCMIDMHAHLDKGHIWPRTENPDGTFGGALASASSDRARYWTADDLGARMSFGLQCAHAHGTAAIRTHLDSISPQHRISWPVFSRLRDEWRGRVELQAVSILLLEHLRGEHGVELADLIAQHRGILGAVVPQTTTLRQDLDRAFTLAAERGLDLDFHADETNDPDAMALRAIAKASLRHRFRGRVVVGHCCSLAVQSDADVRQTLDVVAQARLAVVSLPMCNLFLQDRKAGRTPRWRGVTLLHEMRAHGIPVTIASDNCRDPFFGYGDHDMLEVFRESVRIAHLDRPIGDWPAAVTRTPADVIGLDRAGRVAVGRPADLVLFNARGYSELLSRPQADRIVLRAGRIVDTTPPDYRELDAVLRPR